MQKQTRIAVMELLIVLYLIIISFQNYATIYNLHVLVVSLNIYCLSSHKYVIDNHKNIKPCIFSIFHRRNHCLKSTKTVRNEMVCDGIPSHQSIVSIGNYYVLSEKITTHANYRKQAQIFSLFKPFVRSDNLKCMRDFTCVNYIIQANKEFVYEKPG